MDWTRFKKILTAVLVMIDVVFVIYFVKIKISDSRVDRKTVNNVIEVLAGGNIELDRELFPSNREGCRVCYVSRLTDTESSFANTLKKNGKIFSDDELITVIPNENEKIRLERNSVINACISYMNACGINAEMYSAEKVEISKETAKVSFALTYDKCRFFDSFLNFEVGKNGIEKITGRNIIKDGDVSTYEESLIPVESILCVIPGDKQTEKKVKITGIDFGYYLGKSAGVYVDVLSLPVWKISFDDNTVLYYDARNGNLITKGEMSPL